MLFWKCPDLISERGATDVEALYLLIPISIVIVFVAICIFFGMSDSGQFDDMVGPALRILHDDDNPHDADEHNPPDRTDR